MSGDNDYINEDSNAEDEVLKRLLELKEMYKEQRELNGDSNSGEESFKSKGKHSRSKAEPRLTALQLVILQVVEEHGGMCHVETIVEYVRLKWPELRKRDGTLYHTTECRKLVYANLKGLNLFNQHEQEGYWEINPKWEEGDLDDDTQFPKFDDEAEGLLLLDLNNGFNKLAPMTDIITQAIEDKDGACEVEDIYDFVLRHWERPLLRHSHVRHELTDDKIKESIQVVLRTDPKYLRDPYNQNVYTVVYNQKHGKLVKSSSKGKSSPASVVPRAPSPTPPSVSRVPSHENRARSNSAKRPRTTPPTTPASTSPPSSFSSSLPSSLSSSLPSSSSLSSSSSRALIIPSIPSSPPAGYKCLCGVSEAGGRAGKWHTGQGQWLCHSCGSQWSKKNSCPMCGKVYRNADAKYAIHNSWICCDDCHRWVMAKCDGIEDLSIYDDENPDHIHYSCPFKLCRSIRRRLEEEKIKKEIEDEIVKKENENEAESALELLSSPRTAESPANSSPIHPSLTSPSPSSTSSSLIKPIHPIIPIQAIHPIQAFVQKPLSPIHTSSPPHVPFLSNNPLSPPHSQYIPIPPAGPKVPIGKLFGPSSLNFSAELALAAATKKHRIQEMREEIDALIKIGPPTKIAKNEIINIEPLVKVSSSLPIGIPTPRPQSNKLFVVKKNKHEDALVPSQESTAEILSSMFSPPPFSSISSPFSSSAPNPLTPPSLSSSPTRPLATVRAPIQVQSHPIQPLQVSSASAASAALSPVQSLLGPILGLQLECITPQKGIIQTTHSPSPSPIQSGQIHPQNGVIQFQPTQLLSHLTQTTQLLPLPPNSGNPNFPNVSNNSNISNISNISSSPFNKLQRPFQAPPQPVPTWAPIKYDVISRTSGGGMMNSNNNNSPRGDTNSFDRHMTDAKPASNLAEDLRIFKESLEQERKTVSHLV